MSSGAPSRDGQPSLSAVSADQPKRTVLACVRCRKRKTKCSGDRPCKTCFGAKQECIYLESEKKVMISENYLHDLEARVKAFEGPTAQVTSGITSTSTSSPSSAHDANVEDINNPLMEGVAQLSITPSGQRQYLGNSSSTNFGLRFHNFVKAFKSEDGDIDLGVDYPTFDNGAMPTRRPHISALPQLPPYEQAMRLHAAQYQYIGTIFSFLETRAFSERLKRIYSEPLDFTDREACLSHCQVLLCLAYGQMYAINQWTGNDGPPGFTYFKQALQFLPDLHEEGSDLFIEVLSLVGYFMQNLNRRDAAFLYIGLALRMAISLGLHQEISDPSLDETTREYKRRLWWSVYSMDRILCVKSGNPITIADEDIGVLRPSRLPGLEPEFSSAIVLFHYTKLSSILGKIMEDIYRKTRKAGTTLVASVQSIMTDLSMWLRDLPEYLHLDFNKIENQIIPRESVSIFLHYYQCINMTARPLVFHVVQKRLKASLHSKASQDWREGLSQTTIAVIESCVIAARASATVLSASFKQNLVATYGYMDGEHAFSAAIVLVMVNVAFPFDSRDRDAMDLALDVLKGMADKGNGHVKARRQYLINLRSMVEETPKPPPTVPEPSKPDSPAPHPIDPFTSSNPANFGPPGEEFLNAPFTSLEATAAFSQPVFGLPTTEDANLWEEVYGNIDVGMDFDWTETARMRQR